jgi:hypothetical protein
LCVDHYWQTQAGKLQKPNGMIHRRPQSKHEPGKKWLFTGSKESDTQWTAQQASTELIRPFYYKSHIKNMLCVS